MCRVYFCLLVFVVTTIMFNMVCLPKKKNPHYRETITTSGLNKNRWLLAKTKKGNTMDYATA